MRVEVIREKINVNLPRLIEAGDKAVEEIRRIAINMRKRELAPFRVIADELQSPYTVGVTLEHKSDNAALASIYFDFTDDAKGVYFKLSTEPLIGKS